MAGEQKNIQSTYTLSRLTFREVERELSRLRALILPLGGCEPYGTRGALGIAAACAGAIAAALSEKLHIILAPVFAYGCSTPYGAFGGSAGVKPRTQTNILCETIRQWYLQGFRAIIIIDGLFDNGDAVDLSIQRLKNTNSDLNVVIFSLQRDERIREFTARRAQGNEPGRAEYGMLSLAAYIDPDLVRPSVKSDPAPTLPDANRYRSWRKRGADPQQYRKLFPNGATSDAAEKFNADFGGEVFEFILQLLVDTVEPLLRPHHQ